MAGEKLRRSQVVSFTATDAILGVSWSDIGVVLSAGGDGEPVVIAPLAKTHVLVDPANVQPIQADEVAAAAPAAPAPQG